MKLDFDKSIRYYVNNGKQISFWNDIWCGDTPLRDQFPSLFLVDRVQNAFISSYYHILGGSYHSKNKSCLGLQFSKNFVGDESNDCIQLLANLETVSISLEKDD